MKFSSSNLRRAALALASVLALTLSTVAWGGRTELLWGRGDSVAFTTLGRGFFGAWARPVLLAVRSDCEWTRAMADLAAQGDLITRHPPKPPKDVDWSRQTVVLVAMGRLDGFGVEVRNVSRIGRSLFVDVHVEQTPRLGDVDSSPFHLVAVRTSLEDVVVARYDWHLPGLQTSMTMSSCGSSTTWPTWTQKPAPGGLSPNKGAAIGGSRDPGAGTQVREVSGGPADRTTMTWGGLKSLYR